MAFVIVRAALGLAGQHLKNRLTPAKCLRRNQGFDQLDKMQNASGGILVSMTSAQTISGPQASVLSRNVDLGPAAPV